MAQGKIRFTGIDIPAPLPGFIVIPTYNRAEWWPIANTAYCSGPMIPDTNVGGKIATINEVSDDQKTTFLYS
ncbi:hypothetical protein EZI54_16155 [Marinobacter halodurans]|uniref:Uncharacterized protein n=1 Tax=Marinobacter halodurans TaxID=2528979 RepID=A0ABY1ZHF4_9GAMM|nr:hypothetical protein EZI54_16155 [Marinobacter halodurans]